MITILLATATFLGFGQKTTLADITAKFGSPITIEDTLDEKINQFTFNRDGYLFSADCDKKGNAINLSAYGTNNFVSYKGIKLMCNFSNVIKVMGNPIYYEIKDNQIDLNYEDSSFLLVKLSKKSEYKLFGITVKYQNEQK